MSDVTVTSTRGQAIMGYLPVYYETSRVMKSMVQAGGSEDDQLLAAISGVLDQTFVNRATWNLSQWESDLGITTDTTLTDDQRRSTIKARLRGTGTATLSVVQSVAQSYEKGTIDTTQDIPNYTVHIKFVDTTGIPPNVSDLQAALRAVVPAHLDIIYDYKYFLYNDMDKVAYSWDTWDAKALTWNQWEVYNVT